MINLTTQQSNMSNNTFESGLFLPENKKRLGEGGLRLKCCNKKSVKDQPLISIVTVVYNGEKFLEEAIESVLNQNYENIEYIVIDGGSNDKTLEIIQQYEDKIDYWVSEPDEGQSDAFIKAFSICRGEWLTWLNGDDILLPGAINELVQTAQMYPEVECFTGNVIWTTADNQIIQCRKGERWSDLLPKFGILNVYGPTTFFKRDLYQRVDGINKDLHYMMDTDLWWQFYEAGAKFKRLSRYTWTLRLHEDAKMSGHNFESSAQADFSHPSWIKKRKENQYLKTNHYINVSMLHKNIGRKILLLMRLFSLQYLGGLYDTGRYKNTHFSKLVKAKEC